MVIRTSLPSSCFVSGIINIILDSGKNEECICFTMMCIIH